MSFMKGYGRDYTADGEPVGAEPSGDPYDELLGPEPASRPLPESSSHFRGVLAVEVVFRRWLWVPDPVPLRVTAAAAVAARVDGDPVWLLVVGPPSAGKTETISGHWTREPGGSS